MGVIYGHRVYSKSIYGGRRALENTIKEAKEDPENARCPVDCGFSWEDTPEGHLFWDAAYQRKMPVSQWLPHAEAILIQGMFRYGDWE